MAIEMRMEFVDVLVPGSLKNTVVNGQAVGFEFGVRLAYYRGQFLSCVDKFALAVDGEKLDNREILFCLNDKEFGVDFLPQCSTEFWRLKDAATVRVHRPGGLSAGGHEVDLTLYLRVPYMRMPGAEDGPPKYVPLNSCQKSTMAIGG